MHNTSILVVPVPDLTNTSVIFYSTFAADRSKSPLLVNITYRSTYVNNSNRREETICMNKGDQLRQFEQKLLFSVNGTFSKVLKLRENAIDDLPIFNLVEVRELDLEKNLIKRLENPTYLPSSIEVTFID